MPSLAFSLGNPRHRKDRVVENLSRVLGVPSMHSVGVMPNQFHPEVFVDSRICKARAKSVS
jgi:hypothetical protein